ncbi:nonribosomal peptide synthetase-like protein [Niveomyces insectorum RCEF 264]|uniref:Nonribosomal peptide synthetase-like protein n=1 Tax=Niveomyces insectorum RCEF 264 TaxID=1081102 RepID=A0A167ZW45_9HYPO|nr:nonribosomal peptide synthetase-like protein [Niveomyces insectorum RCEF 264]
MAAIATVSPTSPFVPGVGGNPPAAHRHGPPSGTASADDHSGHGHTQPPPQVINDLLLQRVREAPDTLFFGYPATPKGKTDYVYHTVRDVDRYADAAARAYLAAGLIPEHPSPHRADVVALLAPSTVDYVINTFALSRLGFAVLFLSHRLAGDAVHSLLRATACTKLVVAPQYEARAAQMLQQPDDDDDDDGGGTDRSPCATVSVFRLVEFAAYAAAAAAAAASENDADPVRPLLVTAATTITTNHVALIIHSSGSTGLPKPIFQTHASCLANYADGIPYRAFITLPLFHNHGISTLFRALCAGKTAALYNASLPLAGSTLVDALQAVAPESLHCVPYALKLLAEDPRGIDALRRLQLVLFGGSGCPDELGDRLVAAGVYLAGHYGATEMGQLMTSFRDPATDTDWAYMRPVPAARPYVRMVPRGAGTYECVVLDGLPSKVQSNCDDPPHSFATRDLFTAHPTRPDAWKYLGRLDDRVTLVTGEKVLPVPYEHRIRQHPLVRECVVVGVGRAVPGLVVVPSAAPTTTTALLDALQPTLDAANAHAEAFGRITREMVCVLDPDTAYPTTDKGTVIRAAFYRQFADVIDQMYARLEAPELANADGTDGDGGNTGTKRLDLDEAGLETYLLALFAATLGVSPQQLQADTDLFGAGVDSLQAITARTKIMREIDLGGHVPGQNVVFEFPSVRQLVRHLVALRSGDAAAAAATAGDELKAMRALIAQYSDFSAFPTTTRDADLCPPGGRETVVLTGATGSLGAHLLHQLVREPHVDRVYCLVRVASSSSSSSSPEAAAETRVRAALADRGLPPLDAAAWAKITCLPADLSQDTLGLADDIVGDTERGIWNLTEALPLMFHSALTTGALPALDETPSWMPVDEMARAVLELAGLVPSNRAGTVAADAGDRQLVYHVQNRCLFRWTADLLPALRAAGLRFETVPQRAWVARLRASDPDPRRNPAIKLLGFFAGKYDNDQPGRAGLVFATRRTAAASPTVAAGFDVVGSGLVAKMVAWWQTQWAAAAEGTPKTASKTEQ